jgi:hypothetical protein
VPRIALSFLALVIALPIGLPASAQEASCRLIRGANTPDDPTDDVQVCRQDVWFHQGQTKFGNAGAASGAFPTFNTTKPTASVTTGAGGGYLASSALHQTQAPWDPATSATFDGTFTGDIDNVAVSAYYFNPPEDAQSIPTFAINARVLVDGQVIAEAGGAEVPRAAAGQAKRADFVFTNLYPTLVDLGLSGPGRQHQVRFQIMGTGLASEAAFFVYDTSEVPSGLIFNLEPENLSSYTQVG